jgi:hypothetical protein
MDYPADRGYLGRNHPCGSCSCSCRGSASKGNGRCGDKNRAEPATRERGDPSRRPGPSREPKAAHPRQCSSSRGRRSSTVRGQTTGPGRNILRLSPCRQKYQTLAKVRSADSRGLRVQNGQSRPEAGLIRSSTGISGRRHVARRVGGSRGLDAPESNSRSSRPSGPGLHRSRVISRRR